MSRHRHRFLSTWPFRPFAASRSRIAAVTMWSVLGLAMGVRILDVQLTKARRHGSLTSDQVLNRAEKLCRVILPDCGHIKLYADPVQRTCKDGTHYREWGVDCTDSSGSQLMHMVWSADSGELRSVECAVRPPGRPIRAQLTRVEARRFADHWIRTTEIIPQGQEYHGLGFGERTSVSWRFEFQLKDQLVTVAVEAYSGDLIEAKTGAKAA